MSNKYKPGVIVLISGDFCLLTKNSNIILGDSMDVEIRLGSFSIQRIFQKKYPKVFNSFKDLCKKYPIYNNPKHIKRIIELGGKIKIKKNIG